VGVVVAVMGARYLGIVWFAWNLRDRGASVALADIARYAGLLSTVSPVALAIAVDAPAPFRLAALGASVSAYLAAGHLLGLVPAPLKAMLIRFVASRVGLRQGAS